MFYEVTITISAPYRGCTHTMQRQADTKKDIASLKKAVHMNLNTEIGETAEFDIVKVTKKERVAQ